MLFPSGWWPEHGAKHLIRACGLADFANWRILSVAQSSLKLARTPGCPTNLTVDFTSAPSPLVAPASAAAASRHSKKRSTSAGLQMTCPLSQYQKLKQPRGPPPLRRCISAVASATTSAKTTPHWSEPSGSPCSAPRWARWESPHGKWMSPVCA